MSENDVSCEHGKRWIKVGDGQWMNVVNIEPPCECEPPGGHVPTGWGGKHARCADCGKDICEGMALGTKRPFDSYEFDGRCVECDNKIGPWSQDEIEEAVNQGILVETEDGEYVDPDDLPPDDAGDFSDDDYLGEGTTDDRENDDLGVE